MMLISPNFPTLSLRPSLSTIGPLSIPLLLLVQVGDGAEAGSKGVGKGGGGGMGGGGKGGARAAPHSARGGRAEKRKR